MSFLSCAEGALAQYKREKDATIPLEYFYIERKQGGPLRTLLSKLHVGLSVGAGSSTMRHNLDGFVLSQEADSLPKIYAANNSGVYYGNWISAFSVVSGAGGPAREINADTATVGFRGKQLNLPLKATVHVEINQFRIGGGYSFEYTRPSTFKPTAFADQIDEFDAPFAPFFMKKYFGMIGGTFYRYYEYTIGADLNVGGYKLGRSFDAAAIQRGLYYNIGLVAERDLSEYFKVFIRPSFELKNYTISVPESGLSIRHSFNAWYVNVGVTYRLPELRRCPLKGCHAQINHAHGNREYRSRMHPFWKKQNPHYGENYPELIKYKGRNKRKLHPY